MFTLKQICHENIAQTMLSAPPDLQEMIIGETKDRIIEKVKEEVRNEIRLEMKLELQLQFEQMKEHIRKEIENNLRNEIMNFLPDLVSEIIKDTNLVDQVHNDYPDIPEYITTIAIDIATNIVDELPKNTHSVYTDNYFDMFDNDMDMDTNNIY
jgi:polyribonucleotide nucleotidyltransferase